MAVRRPDWCGVPRRYCAGMYAEPSSDSFGEDGGSHKRQNRNNLLNVLLLYTTLVFAAVQRGAGPVVSPQVSLIATREISWHDLRRSACVV